MKIKSVEDQIVNLNTLLMSLKQERADFVGAFAPPAQQRVDTVAPGKNGGVNYLSDDYEWSKHMKNTMRKVFGIDNYRLCQEG